MAQHRKISEETVYLVAERFKIMSDPMRLMILNCLQEGPLSVMEIVSKTSASQPNVSKHLKILQGAGLVSRRRSGNLAIYQISDDSIFTMCDLVCNSLERRLKTQAEVFSVA
ncbi:MAG: metalloregulator ArsR/SmtB family transcription factor [Pyrinomonadaceae bacterium]